MKKAISLLVVGFLILSGVGAIATSNKETKDGKISLLISQPTIISEQSKYVTSFRLPPSPAYMAGDEPESRLTLFGERKTISHEPQPITYDQHIASLIQRLNESLYLGYLEDLVAFGPRVTGEEACDNAAEYIHDELVTMGLSTRYDNWSASGVAGTNVEATIPGVDKSSDEIYIICAHYDTVYDGPGADDDGSGVAAVLSAAKLVSTWSFNHTIRFIAFSGEEEGLYGSHHYADEAAKNNDNIVAVLNADMIGYAQTIGDASCIIIYENERSHWITNFTANVSSEYAEYITLDVIPGGFAWGSDHYYFWQNNYSAVFYAEYNFNDYYHSSEDTIENMDIDYAVRCSRLIIATLAELSELVVLETPEKPSTPSGSIRGKPNVTYSYTTSTTDPQNDQLYYLFDWGDGTQGEWLGPYGSGVTASAIHTWTLKGTFNVKVKAKDTAGHESEWSDPLRVIMPKHYENPFQHLLERLFEWFLSNIFKIDN